MSKGFDFQPYIEELETLTKEISARQCWPRGPMTRVANVTEFVNLRQQNDLSAPVVGQLSLGELVEVITPNTFYTRVVGGRNGDECINSCQNFEQNPDDVSARDRVQQCIDDNMLWFEIIDSRGNRGWVSRKFLEEAE
jgi:hypothetical protein